MATEQKTGNGSSEPAFSKVESTVELVKRLCLADSISRIYSVNHPNTKQAIASAYEWVAKILEQKGEVAISMSQGKILIEGMPIDERNPMVAKFATGFNQIHADNLFFEKGLTGDELVEFFRVVGQGAKFVNAHGGLPALLKERGVSHVHIKQISYVMVREDEKVVGRDAVVTDSGLAGKMAGDKQLVEYMVKEVLKKAEERQWLIQEIKTNPMKMGQLIQEGIELAASKAESGLTETETIEGLIENIKLVGQSLIDEKTGEEKDQPDLEQAILTMESEVRLRSKKLMSSETAVGFVNEVLAVITSYTDRIKAKRISDEIIKGERTLKQTEKLLKALTPKDVAPDEFLTRVHDLLIARGVKEEELTELITDVAKKPRVRRPRVNKPLSEGIANRLKLQGLDEIQLQDVTAQLTSYFDTELKERTRQLQISFDHLSQELTMRNRLLEEINLGIVMWNCEGVIEFIDSFGQATLARKKGDSLGAELLAATQTFQFPFGPLPEDPRQQPCLTDEDRRFVLAIDHLIKNDTGEAIGALLKHAESKTAP